MSCPRRIGILSCKRLYLHEPSGLDILARLVLFTDSLKESELSLRFPRLQTRDQSVPIPVPSPIRPPRLDYQYRVRFRAGWNES